MSRSDGQLLGAHRHAALSPTQHPHFLQPSFKKREEGGCHIFARTEKQKTFEIENKLQIMIGDRTTSWEDMQLLLFPTMQCLKKQEVGLEVT